MKQRVEEHAHRSSRRGPEDGGNVKLGPGGIRDIEFSVQLLQLVHGAADPSVRSPTTLEAIVALVEGGYLAEEDGAGLSVAYRWLRAVEHRLQLWQERRTHQLPGDEAGRARVARTMGFKDSPVASASTRFDEVHSSVLADVRNRFERLFYRPMIESLAEGSGPRLSPEGLRERLLVLGFRDVDRAARTLDGLVSGTSRRARLFRLLTPAYLRYVASSPVPDEGLFAFLRLGEAVGSRLDALNALRENPPGIEFLARFLGSGRLLGDVLEHVPEELQAIADQRIPETLKDRDRLVREAASSLEWREPERRLDGLRRFKRRAMLQVALADIGGTVDVETVGAGLADLADACVEGALKDIDAPFAVIGMGKLGGRELNYSSDIDVMFVHDTSQEEAEEIAEGLLRSIGEVTPEGQAFRIDANLRPEGKSGPLTRSLDSYLEYYARWAKPWEHQALLKARVAAGDTGVGDALIEGTRRFAYPEQLSADVVTQIRHLKARMERERIPRGTDPRRHLKLGPGGLSDVEFSAQILQLQHAHRVESLRVTSTLPALRVARDEELLSEDDAAPAGRGIYLAHEATQPFVLPVRAPNRRSASDTRRPRSAGHRDGLSGATASRARGGLLADNAAGATLGRVVDLRGQALDAPERVEQLLDRDVVRRIAGAVHERDLSAGIDNHRAPELHRVLLRLGDPPALEDRLCPTHPHRRTHHAAPSRAPQLQQLVAALPGIDEEPEGDVELIAEIGGHLGSAEADRNHVRVERADLVVVVTQLRDLLAAERSAVVPQPHDGNGLIPPQLPEPLRLPIGILQLDVA